MPDQITRRESLKRSFAAAGVLAFADFALPALAQDEVDVPFTDIPANFNPANPNAAVRMLDIRKIDGMITPKDSFFAMQHNNKPEIEAASYRLKLTGMFNKPTELSLADLRKIGSVDVMA